MTPPPAPLLAIDDIEVVYDRVILALHGVSLVVPERSFVALLGANGAGKTTTLLAASRLLTAEGGRVTRGAIHYQGRTIDDLAAHQLVQRGVVQVLEGRHCFAHLTVEDNLIAGSLVRRPSRAALRNDLDRVYRDLPRLAELRRRPAGYLSGGEQQLVAIGRALMTRPRLLLLDEPSMGLAPQIVHGIFAALTELHERAGISLLVAEQNARIALRHADHGYVLENGRVVAHGTAAELSARPDVKEFYLGVGRAPRPQPSQTEVSP